MELEPGSIIVVHLYGVRRVGSSKVRVERSLFIGALLPVSGGDEVAAKVGSIRGKYPDASHQPYAYRVHDEGAITEYGTDDGEPSGTAGRPILEILQAGCLINALLVVTRYYGGRKLGTRRLRQSFQAAAREALDDSGRAEVIEARHLLLRFAIDLTGRVDRVVRKYGGVIEEEKYGDDVELKVALPTAVLTEAVNSLEDVMRDRGQLCVSNGVSYVFS